MVLARGIGLARSTARELVPRGIAGARAIVTSEPAKKIFTGVTSGLRTPAKILATTGSVGLGGALAVHSIRTGFSTPVTQPLFDALIHGVDLQAVEDDHRRRQLEAPTALEFFTSPTFLFLLVGAVVLFLTLRRKGGS